MTTAFTRNWSAHNPLNYGVFVAYDERGNAVARARTEPLAMVAAAQAGYDAARVTVVREA